MMPRQPYRPSRHPAIITALMGMLGLVSSPASARTIVTCAGAALSGGAQLICNHLVPTAPAQLCNYSWALATMTNETQVISGTILVPPGAKNLTAYQGVGFAHAMSEPIVMCQGKRSQPTPHR